MTRGSLRARLLAAGAASIVFALAIAGFGLMLLFERHLEARVTLELESHLRQLVGGLARAGDGSLELAVPLAEPRFNEPLSGLYWQIVVEPDGPVLRSRSLWDAVLDLPPDRLATGEAHRHTIQGPGGASLLAIERQVVLPPDLGGETIRAAVAIDRSQIRAAVLAFASNLVPSLGLLAAFLVLAAWVQVWVGLRPLDAVRCQLAAVVAGRHARFGAAFPDEVRPLAVELDRLLEAQEAAIERARARAGDLAHGLKTPLTVLSAEAEELRARGETRIAGEIATLADAMRRHVERELARGRAGIRARGGAPQPLRGVVDRVVGVLRRTPRGQDLSWSIEVAGEVCTRVDAQDLAEILGNLAENAAKWAKARVRIAARSERCGIVLEVEDDGPGIPEDGIGTVLARGGRLDEAQPGSGLGLVIVSDLVEVYGGALALRRSPLGGLLAEIRLPAEGAGAREPAFDP